MNLKMSNSKRGPRRFDFINYDVTIGDNVRDILFCHTNEIDPDVLDYASSGPESEDEDLPIDPRTGKVVECLVIDCTKSSEKCVAIFENFPTKSSMPARVHQVCLKVLKAKGSDNILSLTDYKTYAYNIQKIQKERELFLEFSKNYEMSRIKDKSSLEEALSNFTTVTLSQEIKRVLRQPNEYFSVVSAIPLRKILVDRQCAEFKTVSLHMYGDVPHGLDDYSGVMKLLERRCSEEHLNEYYENENDASDTSYLQDETDVIIPEHSLFWFLLGLEIDPFEWEMPLSIKENDASSKNILIFGEPFPVREDPFRNEKLLTYASDLSCIQSYSLQHENFNSNETFQTANGTEGYNDAYKLVRIEDFRTSKRKFTKYRNVVYTSATVKSNDSKEKLSLIIKSKIPCYRIIDEKVHFKNVSLKVEEKTEFGAEVMTKSELFYEWIKSIAIPESTTERLRIDVRSSTEFHRQMLHQKDIEAELHNHYDIVASNVFNSLYSTFSILKTNFPPGDYLLKYNSKVSGNIMVHSKYDSPPAMKHTSKHEIYKNITLEKNSMNVKEYIPIDVNIVTPMHEFYKVIPGCFPHWGKRQNLISNDRKRVIDKCLKKEKEKEKKLQGKLEQIKKNRKRVKREKRAQKQKKEKKNKVAEEETLNLLIEGNRNFDENILNDEKNKQIDYPKNLNASFYETKPCPYNDDLLNDVFGCNNLKRSNTNSEEEIVENNYQIDIKDYMAQAQIKDEEEDFVIS